MSDASFPLFLTASLSFPDPVRGLVRPRKTVRIREAFLLWEAPRTTASYWPRRRVHCKWQSSAHISVLPCVGEEPVLPFQLFREGNRGSRDPHDVYKDGEAEPGRFRETHRLCPHTAWKDQSGRHRQTSSVVRKPSERGEVIEIRVTEERRG